jgi:HK97 family phage major capsid protein/HK97 family phage prohead protease
MPFDNVPDDKQEAMHNCVMKLMNEGTPEESAIAICFTSIVEGKTKPQLESAERAAIQAEVKIIAEDANSATVGGYGVVFGGRDLTGDQFTADTDFNLGYVPAPAVFYDHTMTGLNHRLGEVVKITKDEKGLWIEAQLQRSAEYVDEVLQLVKKGVLGWSSGSISHLVRREKGVIKNWTIAEFSLTPTPAEPRTIGVTQLKTIDANAEGGRDDDKNKPSTITENLKMSDEITAAVEAALNKREAEAKAKIEREAELKAAEERGAQKARDEAKATAKAGGYATNIKRVTERGDSNDETKAYLHFFRTGQHNSAVKASNDDEQTVGTTTEGGYAVPTGLVNNIFARKDDMDLAQILGVTRVTGKGTTVDYVVDNEDDGEFVSTSETSNFDRDAAVIDKKSFTLVKYTKKVQLTYELMQDEDAQFEAFITNWVGRGMAKTMNDLLISEVESNGTSLKTFAAAATIAAGEIDVMPFNAALANYLDDSRSVAWVMNPATHGLIYTLSGNNRIYADVTQGNGAGLATGAKGSLLGYPVHYTAAADAYAASKKSVFFGNWSTVGYRLDPELTVLRDPYSSAGAGIVNLHFYFRAVFKVLQAEGIGFGVHPSA